ncbi:MAG TPA: hypothetical protein VJK05_05480 [archaeon]|nr:hypothetical protein [archaeon]
MVKLVFDSSTIISISESCLIKILKNLTNTAGFEFIIPASVEEESVTKPMGINRFKLSAIRIKDGIDEGWIKVWPQSHDIEDEMQSLQELANNIFWLDNKPIEILHRGEAETLALINKTDAEILIIDERTTRLLIENPKSLKSFIEKKHMESVSMDSSMLNGFKKKISHIEIMRSTELMALAFEKGLFEEELGSGKQALEASLFALKYNGCAVSVEEILKYLSTVK